MPATGNLVVPHLNGLNSVPKALRNKRLFGTGALYMEANRMSKKIEKKKADKNIWHFYEIFL